MIFLPSFLLLLAPLSPLPPSHDLGGGQQQQAAAERHTDRHGIEREAVRVGLSCRKTHHIFTRKRHTYTHEHTHTHVYIDSSKGENKSKR